MSGDLSDHVSCMNESGYIRRIKRGNKHITLDPSAKLCKWLRCPVYRYPDNWAKCGLKSLKSRVSNSLSEDSGELNPFARGLGGIRAKKDKKDDDVTYCFPKRECKKGYSQMLCLKRSLRMVDSLETHLHFWPDNKWTKTEARSTSREGNTTKTTATVKADMVAWKEEEGLGAWTSVT